MSTLERSFGTIIPLEEAPPPTPPAPEKKPHEIVNFTKPETPPPPPDEPTPENEKPQIIDNSHIEFDPDKGGIFRVDATKRQNPGFILSNETLVQIADYVNTNRDALDATIKVQQKEENPPPAVALIDYRRILITDRAKLDAHEARQKNVGNNK